MIKRIVIKTDVFILHPNDTVQKLTLIIFEPKKLKSDFYYKLTILTDDNLSSKIFKIYGYNSWQALLLSIKFLKEELISFLKKDDKMYLFYDKDSQNFEIKIDDLFEKM